MSATVTYKGATLTTATNQTRTLDTAGTYLEDDITITDVTTIPTGTKNISITANGTTTEDVTSYASASITANVPNSYTASDEGKVVSNGSLVSQSSATYTANGTYDTTLVDDVTVDVQGGGGGTKTYIIKDGIIQNGYTFSAVQCTVTEETTDGVDYVLIKGTSNNQYQAAYTPLVTVPTGATHIVLELAEIDGSYGYSWFMAGGAYSALSASNAVNTATSAYAEARTTLVDSTGPIQNAITYIGFPGSWTSVSIKICVTGNSARTGIVNIKNLYFES